MRCSYKPQTNSLWSIWYGLITSALTAYLLYLGIRRYMVFAEHAWEFDQRGKIYLIVSVALHGLVVVLAPFFLASTCFKIGNLSSDNERLGERTKKIVDVLDGTPLCRKFKSAWQHGPPTAQTLHLTMAFALLIANALTETQFFKIRDRLKQNEIWSTDLNFIFDRRSGDDQLIQLARSERTFIGNRRDLNQDPNQPHRPSYGNDMLFADQGQQQRRSSNNLQQQQQFQQNFNSDRYAAFESSQKQEQFYQPAIAAGDQNENQEQLLIDSSNVNNNNNNNLDSTFEASAEFPANAPIAPIDDSLIPLLSNFRLYGVSLLFLNYFLALLIYACVYPAAYWRANKPFAFVFSCHLLLHAITAIFAYISFLLLYRQYYAGPYSDTSATYNGNGIANIRNTTFILNEYLLLAVYVSSCAILFFASSVVYGYGYNKFCLRLLSVAGRGHTLRSRGAKTSHGAVCCEGYSPHIAAILMLILMVAAKAPLLYDQMLSYQKTGKTITLTCIVVDVMYLFAWILLWLALTLKREWAFKVRYTNSEIGALLGVRTDENRPVKDTTLMIVCGDDYFATDDETKRAALLQLAEKCGFAQHEEEVYWLKPASAGRGVPNDNQQNQQRYQNQQKAAIINAAAGTPEMNNLLAGTPTNAQTINAQQQRNQYLSQQQQLQLQQQQLQQQQSNAGKAATIGASAGTHYKRYGVNNGSNNNNTLGGPGSGYGKVSFNDAGDLEFHQQQQLQQQQRFGPGGSRAGSGSYVRFSDDQSTGLLNYDEHAQDVVTTFGTLPRQEYRRRKLLHQDGGDTVDFFQAPSNSAAPAASTATQPALPPAQQTQRVQTLANVGQMKRTPSPMNVRRQQQLIEPVDAVIGANVAYASVHKRSNASGGGGSPVRDNTTYGGHRMAVVPSPENDQLTNSDLQNVSRVSSYANIPSKQTAAAWDSTSLNRSTNSDAARPPTGRTAVAPFPQQQQQQPQPQNQQLQQQYHHHQHHYNMSGSASPYSSLPHPPSVASLPMNTPTQGRRHVQHPINETVTLIQQAPRASPNLDPTMTNGRKLTSFSNSSSGGATGGESSDTTPTGQQSIYGVGQTVPINVLTTSSGSSREMTPLSNTSGSLSRPSKSIQPGFPTGWQPANANLYGQGQSSSQSQTPTTRSQTPQSSYGSVTPTTPGSGVGGAGSTTNNNASNVSGGASHQPSTYGIGTRGASTVTTALVNNRDPNVGLVYGQHAGGGQQQQMYYHTQPSPAPANHRQQSTGTGGRTLLGLEPHDRNDSANFSLTSSNESENNHFVTSMV